MLMEEETELLFNNFFEHDLKPGLSHLSEKCLEFYFGLVF